MTSTTLLVVLVAVVAPLVFYVIAGWRDHAAKRSIAADGSEAESSDETVQFFAAGRGLSVPQYATTTVAYGLQMAAVILFAQWGYYYGYSTFLVPIAWSLGFVLLGLAAQQLDTFLQDPQTLHGFLGDQHGGGREVGSPTLVRIAAIATLLGLGGALFAELGYTSDLLQHLLGRTDSFRYLLMAFFLASALTYVLPGGFRAVVDTDRRQLPVSYIGLAALLSTVIFMGTRLGADVAAPAVIGTLSFGAIAVTAVVGIVGSDTKPKLARIVSVTVPIVSLGLVVAAYGFGTSLPAGVLPSGVSSAPWSPQPMAMLAGLSLLLANGLWQFVDLSAFQRLTALHLPESSAQRTKVLRKAIFWTALESPVSWCIGIAIGIALGQLGTFGGPDAAWTAYEAFLGALATGEGIGTVLPLTLRMAVVGLCLAAFVAIMLSSVDSLGSAVAYTTTSDLLGMKRGVPTNRARVITVVVIVGIWGLLALWQAFLSPGHNISAWLYTAYAMQLSLLGVCICALLGVRLPPPLAIASVALGVVASVGTGIVLVARANPDVYVLPPIVAASVSLLLVLLPLGRSLLSRGGGAAR